MKFFPFRRAAREEHAHDGHEDDDAPVATAASLGLMACRHCGAVWKDAQEGEACGRCGTRLHTRKPQSLNRTWAFLIAACMMYIPANLLPVMITRTLFGAQYDTILSGVIYFWVSGAYGLAAIVFIASFLVPLFKLAVLLLLVVLAQRGSTWRQRERARLYHIIEVIGRWSMLDVFVVSLLTGLVQIQGFAVITAGVGIAAFGSVVVLTMLASLSFDPKLTWDSKEEQALAEGRDVPQEHGKRDEKPA
ncbi:MULTISPECIES: paraquat-inducible protein A [unclassified Variovorax]|uniref:paraquat-inducible protein A n=1 Tax=unclassified Variovorax TaxID=663243 RepID=UPI000D12B35F|nr:MULTISPECIES: paraquat-inducible protein A [unclassified Variovorax]AVQ80325.1 paraquat-inducible membrane protein A [Variovorax sp. PMC12]QRY30268.1 paraquat-inducible protein A [Variovorax sp. PDNC026]